MGKRSVVVSDFDNTITGIHTLKPQEENAPPLNPGNNLKEGVRLALLPDGSDRLLNVATYHFDVDLVKEYLEKMLGETLTKVAQTIHEHDVLTEFSSTSGKPVLISTIPKDGYNEHFLALFPEGKNCQIQHVMDYLTKKALADNESKIYFFDDSETNFKNARTLCNKYLNMQCHHVDENNEKFKIIKSYPHEKRSLLHSSSESKLYPELEFSNSSSESEDDLVPENKSDKQIQSASFWSSLETELTMTINLLKGHKSNIPQRNGLGKSYAIESLVRNLQDVKNDFFTTPDQKKDLAVFKKNFRDTLHRHDEKISAHRKLWKPVLANILFASTGIGAIYLLGHALHVALTDSGTHDTSFINRYGLFGQTQSEKKRDAIETVLDKMDLEWGDKSEKMTMQA